MSDLNYGRCPHDDVQIGFACVGENPETGKSIEIDIHGVNAAVSVQAALTALTASMKVGHEPDFLERVALALYDGVRADPHSLCPLVTLTNMLLRLVRGTACVTFGDDGRVIIGPPNEDPEPPCVHGEHKESSDELHEEEMDRDGTGTGGEGDGPEGPGDAPPDDGGGIAP